MIILENEIEPLDKFLLRRVFRDNSILEYWATRSLNKLKINSNTTIYKCVLKKNNKKNEYFDNFNYTINGFKN